eukprot:g1693.t1
MSGLLVLPATIVSSTEARCELPVLGTGGNTSVCLVTGKVFDKYGPAPPAGRCTAGANNVTYAPTYFSRFALFSPAFGRRPYFRETNGAIVVLTDYSTAGMDLTLSATVGGGTTPVSARIAGGTNRSIPFSLGKMPAAVAEDVVITLSGFPDGSSVSHTRRFLRAPPPPAGSTIASWQVDHEIKGLRVDGHRFVPVGWFGSGGIHESAGMPVEAVVAPGKVSLERLQMLATASVTTEFARGQINFVKAGPVPYGDRTTALLTKEYLDAAAAAGVYVLVQPPIDGLALAEAGQIVKKTGQPRNATLFREWVLGNISMFKDHPAVGGYYGCDDCCHTSIAIEHNLGPGCEGAGAGSGLKAGPASASGCPGEYHALASIREEIYKADPYHLVFGTVARCFNDGSFYWTEEGAGLGLDVLMHEGYGAGITTGLDGVRHTFPTEWTNFVNMPDPSSLGPRHAIRAHTYAGALSGDGWGLSTFVYNQEQYYDTRANSAILDYAGEVAELLPSMLSSQWSEDPAAGGPCISWNSPCPVSVNVTMVDLPELLPHPDRVDNRPVRVVSRLLLEAAPPDALPGYYCMHVVVVSEASAPSLLQYKFSGLPPNATSMQRLFNSDYSVNISADTGIAHDILGGKSVAVHRIGCGGAGSGFLPATNPREMVKGGDFEATAEVGPGLLLSDHHYGPWYVAHSGVEDDLARPGFLLPHGPMTDERVRVNADTADAHGGRHAALVNLASQVEVRFPVPLWKLPPGLVHGQLTVWARSSPPGVVVTPQVSSQTQGSPVTLGVEWTPLHAHLTVNGSASAGARTTVVQLVLNSPHSTGGKVWLDDLSFICDKGNASVPCA